MRGMSPPWQSAALGLVSDLRRIFGDRLQSVVAYGPALDGDAGAPLSALALVGDLAVGDLEACARESRHWHRAGIGTPLLLPEGEFRRSLDAFPLEYGEIIRAHQRIFGNDPFDGITIVPEDLRRACETQIKSHLIHLRESFLEAGGRPDAIAEIVTASAPGFTALLRHVASLNGRPAQDRAQATRDGGRAANLPEGIVSDLLALEQGAGVPTSDAARLFPDYLAAVEQLAHVVDAWRC